MKRSLSSFTRRFLWGAIMLLLCISLSVDLFAQQQKISLAFRDKPMIEIFNKIEEQTRLTIAYNKSTIDVDRKVTIAVTGKSLDETMKLLLKDTRATYRLDGHQIIIIPERKAAPDQKDMSPASSGSITVMGIITDDTNKGIPGVTVIEKGQNNGVISDATGRYKLAVAADATLSFSMIGFKQTEVPVNGRSEINLLLPGNSKVLDQVVVIGYGTVKKSSLTGAISSMNATALNDRSLARVESALQGNVSGVTVRNTTGEPGQSLQVRVRGAASINAGADPLYVVDGLPVADLSALNPADISSIEVLKDAASAAIYGSRGSNGVVMVTTKRGKSGKPRLSFSASTGVQSLEKKMDLLSATEWMKFAIKWIDVNYLTTAKARGIANASVSDPNNVRMANVGGSITAPDYKIILDNRWFNYMDDATKSAHTFQPTTEGLSLLDWQDKFYRNALIQDYNVNLSGGNENTTYLFSVGHLNQKGIATGTDYERYTFRTNVESKINNYLTAGMQLVPTYVIRNGGGLASGKDAQSQAILQSVPVSKEGVGYDVNIDPNPSYEWGYPFLNPLAKMTTNIRREETLQLMGSAFIRLQPVKGLRIEGTASLNFRDVGLRTYNYSRVNPSWIQGEGANSSASAETDRVLDRLFQVVANYDKTLGKHSFNLMAGTSAEQRSVGYATSQSFLKPFPNDANTESFDGSSLNVGADLVSAHTPTRISSYFGRLQYNFADRYLLSGSMRYDGGSVFGSSNKWGLFPAISGAWNISNENFYKAVGPGWLSVLKLRASYGVTGNNAISSSAAYSTLGGVIYAGSPGYIAGTLGNNDLGWEKTYSTDVALDLGMMDNRILVSLDWYTKKTKNLLYQIPTFSASGFTSTWGNLGSIYNTGFETEVSSRNLTGRFKWNTSFNMSYNQNKVLQLGASNTPVYTGFDGSNPSNVLMVGRPVYAYYMYEAIGVWKTQQEIDEFSASHGGKAATFEGKPLRPGDIRYKDQNNDGTFDKGNDRAFLGTPTPRFTYGITNTFEYRNFDLSVLVVAQTGGKIAGIIGRAIDRPSMGYFQNALGHWRDAWWSETDQGNGNVPYPMSTTTGAVVDSRWLYSSDYIRIKNLTLGYKLPVNTAVIPYARVFVSVENLAKWDRYYGGYNAESANAGNAVLGIDYGGYPLARTFMLGLNVNF